MRRNCPAWAVLALAVCAGTARAQTVSSLTLIDADTDQPVAGFALTDGATINLATMPTRRLNVRANTSPATVGSVRFVLDGGAINRIENAAPYALAGDTNGNYNPWTPAVGAHTLTVTPYSAANGGGVTGTALTVRFSVLDEPVNPGPGAPAGVSGELKLWHRITVTFDGPATSETATPNPFRDYRLNVTFRKGTRAITVPGYYAADGNAGESGAASGNKWRAHFVADEAGTWTYTASFRTGTDIAASLSADAGTAVAPLDGATGSFTVGATDKAGRDFRAHGLLQYVGQRYLRFAGSGEYFVKGGADSPENFLAFFEFDGTPDKHRYAPHAGDWKTGDPAWRGGKGKNIIGALNYLAGKGMNSVYFLTMNVNGDGKDVWPWTASTERYRFDCSKLDQWELVFSHMDALGLMMHVVTQETENDQLLDGGELGVQRKLYHRELVARFGHHLAIVWNLGEENTNTDAQRKAFADHIRALDVYAHPTVIHTFPGQYDSVYTPLLGHGTLEGPSLQMGNMNSTHSETLKWVARSAAAGRQWVVCLDEIGPANAGVVPDSVDFWHDNVRKQALWGNLMAGGAGCEWYFGYSYAHHDLTCEDWRSRDHMWDLTRHALEFFRDHLPYPDMAPADALVSAAGAWCLADPGETYAVYLPNGGTTLLDLQTSTAEFSVRWYNPRAGGELQTGTVSTIRGPGKVSIGEPPAQATSDWVVLVRYAGDGNDPPSGIGLLAEYFDTADLTGPSLLRIDATVDFSWGNGSPDPAIGADTFSARWTGQVEPEFSEVYTFHVVSDDGVRLWVDGQLIIDNWTDHAPTENSGQIALVAGRRYDIKLEYYENGGGAVARMLWSSPSRAKEVVPSERLYPADPPAAEPTGTGLKATYYRNPDLTDAALTRIDPVVDFAWGTGGPDPAVDGDAFSVRWTGQIQPEFSETYTLTTLSNDGVRVWIDGVLVIDNWTQHTAKEDSAVVELVAGRKYDIQIEYFQLGGTATMRLSWGSASVPKAVVPQNRLYPAP